MPTNTTPPSSSQPTVDRPDWLPIEVWPFEPKFLTVDGHRVAYTDVGSGPTLLFSHAGQWSFIWRDVIKELSTTFRCVAYDPLGSGLSDRVRRDLQNLDAVRDVVGAIIDQLDLRQVTLVMHDLGGVTALAAGSTRLDRIAAIAAINTFGWKPSGVMFRSMLWMFGSAPMREVDAFTGFLPKASSRRFGVGRHFDRPSRKAFRNGIRDRDSRRTMHRLFRDARVNRTIYTQAATMTAAMGDRPVLTVFGSLGDYLGFQKRWRRLLPHVTQKVVRRGLHFPMCDNPTITAQHIRDWHRAEVTRRA